MDVRKWLHSKILFDVDGMAHREQVDLIVPPITKLVEALRQFVGSHPSAGSHDSHCAAFPASSEEEVLRKCNCRVSVARAALAELEKP